LKLDNSNFTSDFIKTVESLNKNAKLILSEAVKSERMGITVDQWMILLFLLDKEPQAQIDIAKFVNKDPASLTRMIDIIENKGFVNRVGVANDRRKFGIQLTVEGRRKAKSSQILFEKTNALFLDIFNAEDLLKLQQINESLVNL